MKWRSVLLVALTAAVAVATPFLVLSATQSSLHPTGVQAKHLYWLWTVYFYVCVSVYIVVTVGLVLAIWRQLPRGELSRPTISPEGSEPRISWVVVTAVAASLTILFVLLLGDFVTGRAIDSLRDNAIAIRVTARQWWWEFRYQDPVASNVFITANEIHIPVGRTVSLELTSHDVIHSFWAPNLHGKTDAIPGMSTWTFLRADRAGVYRGQCAEFCGLEHANMRFTVVAEPAADYERWLAEQRAPAHEAQSPRQQRGKDIFQSRMCATCHSVNGTSAQGRVGPDLTHLMSRRNIAAGTLPNTRGNLAGWVVNAQRHKPGIRMPAIPLQPTELQALLDYLESLH